MVGVLLQDHEVRQSEFQQLPYHRIFIMLLLELNAPEHVLETINFQTLTAFWYVALNRLVLVLSLDPIRKFIFKSSVTVL